MSLHEGSKLLPHSTTNIEIIPITLNYKYECELSDKLNWYAGAGAGIALVDVDYRRVFHLMVAGLWSPTILRLRR